MSKHLTGSLAGTVRRPMVTLPDLDGDANLPDMSSLKVRNYNY